MKKLLKRPIKACTESLELSGVDLIDILNRLPEIKPLDISLEHSPNGTILLAVGDTVYEISENIE